MLESLHMPLVLAIGALHWVFMIPIAVLSVFLTLLILVQRGRGGGLTGALGGMGGQSAFGTKAGDVFTKITIVVAMLWIVLSMGALRVLHVGKLVKSNVPPASKSTDGKKGADGKTDGTLPPDSTPLPGVTPESTPAPKGTTPPAATETPPATPNTTTPEGDAKK